MVDKQYFAWSQLIFTAILSGISLEEILSFFIPVFRCGFWLFLTLAEWQRQCFSAHPATSILRLLFSCFVLCLYSSQSADDWEAKIHLFCCLLLIFLPPPKMRKKKCNKPLIPNIFIWSHALHPNPNRSNTFFHSTPILYYS